MASSGALALTFLLDAFSMTALPKLMACQIWRKDRMQALELEHRKRTSAAVVACGQHGHPW